ncbi:MAG: T9SS type A sorting domain-containing protein [Flavobacteriaceae bacterium]
MKHKYTLYFLTSFLLTFSTSLWSQLSVGATNTNTIITFDATLSGVNFGAFTGAGINPTATAGQIDGNAWAITGLSDGDYAFDDIAITTGDFARSDNDLGATTGGLYSFDLSALGTGYTLGVQPIGADFTPGTITLKITNNTGFTVTSIAIAYELWVRNDQDRSNSFNFSYSTSSAGPFTDVGALDYTSTAAQDANSWQLNNRSTVITGLSIADGSDFFIRWTGNDVGGSGNRDEFAIDDITVNMNPNTTWDGSTDTDWNISANWSNGVPTFGSDVTIPDLTNDPIIGATTGASVNDISITNGVLSITSGGSLIVGGTSTGDLTYNVNVTDTNWHLISAPVEGEQYDDTWNTANSVDQTGQTNTLAGVSTYLNTTDANGDWSYFTIGNPAQTFNTGQGYSMLRTGAGDYAFIGTMKTTDASIAITANDIGGGGENRWTLIGNPFPSYVSITSFLGLAANATALEDTREAVYVWNGSAYAPLTTGYIHPGQGFFVNSNIASTSVAINEDMLSHQTGVTFYRNATTDPSIELILSDGQNTKMTAIKYTEGKTTGLDPRFDLGTFNGTANSFHVYTHLVSNSQGVDFMRQSLPNSNHENMIIPIGVNINLALDDTTNEEIPKEIVFTANVENIPNGLNVFIEDKENNTFTQLDDTNAEYRITFLSSYNGIGRFYLHMNTEAALSTNSFDLNTISIYKTSNTNLRITGVRSGDTALKIFDILGKQMLQTNFEAHGLHDITLPGVKPGIYIVQLETDQGKLNQKIIIE